MLPNIFGKKTTSALREIIPNISENIIKEVNSRRQLYIQEKILELKPLLGIKKILEQLNSKYIIGLTTGSKSNVVKKFLQYHNIKRYFSVITTGEHFKSSKPDPECYLITLKELNIKPSETIIVEDSEAGIIAGKKAGCKVFGLKNKYNTAQLKKADKAFDNYKEMLIYFKEKF
jgi:HAD superfamily hydrolase (TIGR01509 family)